MLSENYCLPPALMIKNLFSFESGPDISNITSDPLRVCFCNDHEDKPDCLKLQVKKCVHPGASFNIALATVGDMFGAVKGVVYASFVLMKGRTKPSLKESQYTQGIETKGCSVLYYTLSSSSVNESEFLILSTANSQPNTLSKLGDAIDTYNKTECITQELLTSTISINVTLLPCPTGFELTNKTCDCNKRLSEAGTSCNIDSGYVRRSGTLWVSASSSDNTSNEVIIGKYCPLSYCKSEAVDVDLEHPDSQCAFNHSGTLCGGCQQGLSLVLGSPQCLPCHNIYLLLLVPFALAGLAIVFFIKILDLTVSRGTINGLIFYANAIGANEAVFFADHGSSSRLKVFIAWLNLDLGIETCFFDGLTAYEKVWLQFAFPLYIWAIAGVVIATAHYSPTAAKIFGNNSVPVLATLFLLSYTKLLQTITSVFSFSLLEYPTRTAPVWYVDGTIGYLSRFHIPLFLFALAFFLFLWLPGTAILLFWPCLQRMGNPQHKVLKLIVKLKPVFDAFCGPFKDKHRYWVGILLLARVVLQITSAATPTNRGSVELLTLSVLTLVLLTFTATVGQVYRKWFMSHFENSFFINLNLLALGTLYAKYVNHHRNPSAVVYTSVSIAFAQFVFIIVAHICMKVQVYHRFRGSCAQSLLNGPGYKHLDESQFKETQEHPSADLRESLLEDSTPSSGYPKEKNDSVQQDD